MNLNETRAAVCTKFHIKKIHRSWILLLTIEGSYEFEIYACLFRLPSVISYNNVTDLKIV